MINLQTTCHASHWNTTTRLGFGKYRSLNKADKGINFSRKGFAAIHTKMNLVEEEHVEPPRFWQIVTTDAHIQGRGVLHFPRSIVTNYLPHHQQHINIVLHNSNISVNCTIKTSQRNWNERYLSQEWVAFLNEANIKVNYRLKLTLSNPPDVLSVEIIN
ncbi:uncharacterized protein LOC123916731 [Trifolium pratense]|uniref:uncharacterized protein LOC123916731 n=1 Tax=Trifolium pratense TaxID=57577 RepID=UPI001E691DE9|nr:uncharacterized protein LOC123916731 [Trifolium pratense]